MTVRVKMFCLDENMSVQKAISIINNYGFSRIPIYRDDKDNITGILYVKDLLKLKSRNRKQKLKLHEIAKKPFFVEKEMIISKIFRQFQKRHMHIAIVLDENGGTEGLVTMEDLVEEVFGEIIDETDLSPDMILRENKNTIIVHSDTLISDINNFFNVNIPYSKTYPSITKFVYKRIKRPVKVGSCVKYKNLVFTVEEMFDRKIIKINIEKV